MSTLPHHTEVTMNSPPPSQPLISQSLFMTDDPLSPLPRLSTISPSPPPLFKDQCISQIRFEREEAPMAFCFTEIVWNKKPKNYTSFKIKFVLIDSYHPDYRIRVDVLSWLEARKETSCISGKPNPFFWLRIRDDSKVCTLWTFHLVTKQYTFCDK